MEKEKLERLKREIFKYGAYEVVNFLGYEFDVDEDKDVTDRRLDMKLEEMSEEELEQWYKEYCFKELHISMAYTFVGDTAIDIPIEILEGKTEEEQYETAFNYAQDHIGEIPIAQNPQYIPDSDNFEQEDIEWMNNWIAKRI